MFTLMGMVMYFKFLNSDPVILQYFPARGPHWGTYLLLGLGVSNIGLKGLIPYTSLGCVEGPLEKHQLQSEALSPKPYGGLSKLWSLFGVPIIIRGLMRSLILGDPKRGHNFDNPPICRFDVGSKLEASTTVWGVLTLCPPAMRASNN